MVRVTEDLKCVTYNLMSVAQDLLNDGDHGQHAVFRYTEDRHPTSNIRQFGEMWTGDWWKKQQKELHDGANILVPIIYMDETPVTHNGRNMHPIYMSLGNLYLDSRYASSFTHPLQYYFFNRQKLSGKRLLGFMPTINVVTKYRDSALVRRYKRNVHRKALAHITAPITQLYQSASRGTTLNVNGSGKCNS